MNARRLEKKLVALLAATSTDKLEFSLATHREALKVFMGGTYRDADYWVLSDLRAIRLIKAELATR